VQFRNYAHMSHISKEREPLHEQVVKSAIHRIPSHIKRKIKSLARKDLTARTMQLAYVRMS